MSKKKGFTLIELLVVIAIIALLLSVLIPALRVAKRVASGVVCVSNTRSLSLAWFMYAEDNNSLLVGAGTNGSGTATLPKYDWVGSPMDEDGVYRMETLEDRLRGIQDGLLFPYTKDTKVYHCNSDKRLRKNGGSGSLAGYRSYSIQNFMNGWDDAAPGTRPREVAIKKSEISQPSSKIVIVEEADPRGFNWGGWSLPLWDEKHWGDWLAIWHGGRSTFGYADGHAELHKWLDDTTLVITESETPTKIYVGDSEDLKYMLRAIRPKRK